MDKNIVLIMEIKWRDKHYYDEIDIDYGKVINTLSDAYSNQLAKHKKFIERPNSLDYIFQDDKRYKKGVTPRFYYLVIDKRCQLHYEDMHMITEYMLLCFLRSCIHINKLNLEDFWEIIINLKTTVDYSPTGNYDKQVNIGEYKIFINEELHMDY